MRIKQLEVGIGDARNADGGEGQVTLDGSAGLLERRAERMQGDTGTTERQDDMIRFCVDVATWRRGDVGAWGRKRKRTRRQTSSEVTCGYASRKKAISSSPTPTITVRGA